MMEVVNVRWWTTEDGYPTWVELTFANGVKLRYRYEGEG